MLPTQAISSPSVSEAGTLGQLGPAAQSLYNRDQQAWHRRQQLYAAVQVSQPPPTWSTLQSLGPKTAQKVTEAPSLVGTGGLHPTNVTLGLPPLCLEGFLAPSDLEQQATYQEELTVDDSANYDVFGWVDDQGTALAPVHGSFKP
jgi:hypothetical protein